MFAHLFPQQLWKDRHLAILFGMSLAINLTAWFLLLLRTWGLRGEVTQFALHYTIYFGIDRLGAWWQIFRGPFAGLVVLVINLALAGFMLARERAWSLVVGVATALLEVLILLGAIVVILLNV